MVQAVLNRRARMLNGGMAVTTRTSSTGMITAIGLVTSPTMILGSRKRSGNPRTRKVRDSRSTSRIVVFEARSMCTRGATTHESGEPEKYEE